jgi:hypothetical protein
MTAVVSSVISHSMTVIVQRFNPIIQPLNIPGIHRIVRRSSVLSINQV